MLEPTVKMPESTPEQIREEMEIDVNRQVDFRRELEYLINKYSMERGSDTPDYILAEYLMNCLKNFDNTVNARNRWYGDEV